MTQEKLNEILEAHKLWLNDKGGSGANLSDANLRNANLRNANLTNDCGCGINVAPLRWVKKNFNKQIWKLLIKWEWLPGVVVPYSTDGKIRCERAMILGRVDENGDLVEEEIENGLQ